METATVEYDYRNETHVEARARKAVPNEGLRWIAVMAAKQHRYGIEYIEQAPVLVIAATFGSSVKQLSKMRPIERNFVAHRFSRIKDMKLKAAMKEFSVPYPMRKLRSIAIIPSFSRVIWELRRVPPSSLSQAIPDKASHQRSWLNALNEAHHRSEIRGRAFPEGALEWLAMRLGGDTPKHYSYRHLARHAADVADMLMVGRFNPALTFDEARAAHARWVTELTKKDALGKFVTQFGVDLDHEVDYTPQPNAAMTIGDFEVVPLRSGSALFEDGTYMRHCVASYMKEILSTACCLYSIRDRSGRRLATLQTTSGYGPVVIAQLKGPCNAAVPKHITSVAHEFVAAISVKRPSAMDKIKGLFGK